MASNTPLADLSAAGVSIWLDDLSRQRIESGNLASLIEDSEVVGVTSNPTIFASAFADADHYAEDLDAPRRPGRLGRGRDPRAHHRGRPPRLRRVPQRVAAHRRHRRPGLARGRPGQGPRHRGDRRRGGRPVEDRRPAQPDGQDPGDARGHPRDHPHARRGHQRQRHADLLGRPLPPGDGRLPRRHGAGPGQRPRPHGRWPRSRRSSSPASTPRSTSASRRDRHRRRAEPARHRRHRQRAPRVRAPSSRCSAPSGGPRSRAPAPSAQRPLWASTGREEQGLPGHALRHRAGRAEHRQHDARGHPRRRSPTTASCTATP